ncbi:methionine--tRNA ligase [Bacillus suaedaesalsae]|uniref:Methionine--tRNA ligase n=1 Tax=Bacillus suaedaesalsae TaxID=2810349 RepID=A0ABS2DI21_9BACI|nr:methionine--tRNA ligase [Bacillus suaedaesalsae]MBM6618139.1 methionine--tRNA ligase [Bacillus suaedaesalsae]
MGIFIGGAWPYANGSLHVGHISSLLPGDIIARYLRLKGENVLYVSGSDCNGTPIALRARQEGKAVEEITNRYHEEFEVCFRKLGFSFDYYSRTDQIEHHHVVQTVFLELFKKGYIYSRNVEQSYCDCCEQFLPDRYVEGVCPVCHKDARGDQCDHCSTILDPLDLINRSCKLCGSSPSVRETQHLYFRLSSFQHQLQHLVDIAETSNAWRENAIHLSNRYIREGLHDRAVTRDLPIGVQVPVGGYEDKKIYVWIEAVAGYLSASKQWSEKFDEKLDSFWNVEGKAYYVHGKDNIPFHTIIWPAILQGIGEHRLPTHIISNEYLTIERKKISTSKNFAVWIPELLENFHPDSIRYFLTINAPEKKDADFSWREFVYSNNSELLGAFGNFVNRTLKFINNVFDGSIPVGHIDDIQRSRIEKLYDTVGEKIERGDCKNALQEVFEFIRESNRYFDQRQPWITINTDRNQCEQTLYSCLQIIANLSNLLSPFLPFTAETIKGFLQLKENTSWNYIETTSTTIGDVEVLFERIDPSIIDSERKKLAL